MSPNLNLVPLTFFAASLLAVPCFSETEPSTLNLDQFLKQVVSGHSGYKGSILGSHAADLRSVEGKLLTLPTAYLNAKNNFDGKITPFSFIQYNQMNTSTFSLGVKETTNFGLQADLHYDIFSTQYINPYLATPIPGFSSLFSKPYINASPVLEVTQSLWNNGFGRSTQANQEAIEAQAMATNYTNRFQSKSILSKAESAYWKLAISRQTIAIQTEAIDRAQKIYDWNLNRAKLHLGDESDTLSAQALLESRALDVISAKNEEKSAARALNSERNIESDTVQESLTEIGSDFIDQLPIPKRAAMKDDVKAAQETARASQANATLSIEKNNPILEVFGNVSLNGQPQNLLNSPYDGSVSLGQSMGLSFQPNRPTYAVGVRLSVPLAFGTINQVKDGWGEEKVASELLYDRKVFEQEQSWKDLNQNLNELKEHLALSKKLEATQKLKLEKEKDRLTKGRTTTYQVLLFEQDYLLAELARIHDQSSILNIIAQMKLFGETL